MKFSKGWDKASPGYPLILPPKANLVNAVDPTIVDETLDLGQVVVEPTHYRVNPYVLPADVEQYVPAYDSDQFWHEFLEVARRRQREYVETSYSSMRDDEPAYRFRHPEFEDMRLLSPLLADIDKPEIGARMVHLDFPTELATRLIAKLPDYLWRDGLIPSTNHIDFRTRPIILSELIGWAIRTVNPTAFALKWHFGQPRPEEVFEAWRTKDPDFDCPVWVDAALVDMYSDNYLVMEGDTNFTAYPEGCPLHPSAPAMHGGAAGVTSLLCLFFDFERDDAAWQYKRYVDLAAWNWAHWRDDAGVHYESDSNLGLEVGSRVMRATLPKKMAEFGANPDEVSEILEKHRVNWV